MNGGPIAQGEFASYTLAEVAVQLGVTAQDTANPVRFIRDLMRRHSIAFVRIGRTIKVRPEHVRLLAERMVVQPSTLATLEISRSEIFGITEAGRGRSLAPAIIAPVSRGRARSDMLKVLNPLAKTKPRKPKSSRAKPDHHLLKAWHDETADHLSPSRGS